MSYPNIPSIVPTISLSMEQTVPLLLSSIALEELALAHLINTQAEKLQFVLGTLPPTRTTLTPATVSLSNLLDINEDVRHTLQDVIKKEMLLQFKFENILELIQALPVPTPSFECRCNVTSTGAFRVPEVKITLLGVSVAGAIDLNIDICPQCHPQGSHFDFHFLETGLGGQEATLQINANDITNVICGANEVDLIGTGTLHLAGGIDISGQFTVKITPTSITVSIPGVITAVVPVLPGTLTFGACPI